MSATPPPTPSALSNKKKTLMDVGDLPLVKIFERLPLRDLLQVGGLCVRFGALQKYALSSRQSITVVHKPELEPGFFSDSYSIPFGSELKNVLNSDGTRVIPLSEISSVSQLSSRIARKDWICVSTPTAVKTICNALPFVRTLEVVFKENADCVNELLKHWRTSLVKLSVWFEYPTHDEYPNIWDIVAHERMLVVKGRNVRQLVDTIQSLPALKHLSLEHKDVGMYKWNMPQLVSFYCDGSANLASTMAGYLKPDSPIQRLGASALHKPQNVDHQVALKFTYLAIGSHSLEVLSNFLNLTNLSLTLDPTMENPLSTLAKALAKLNRLIYLHLSMQASIREVSSEPIVQLSQIKVLSVKFYALASIHYSLEPLKLHWTFPSLVAIKVLAQQRWPCVDCGSRILPASNKCREKLLTPLRRCSGLKKVEVGAANWLMSPPSGYCLLVDRVDQLGPIEQ